MEREILRTAIARKRCEELQAAIERERGPGIEANVHSAEPDAEAQARWIRNAARLLPAKWVRRANMPPGVTIKVGVAGPSEDLTADYNPASKTITVYAGTSEDAALHAYLHYIQELHPEIDSLFYTFRRNYDRPFAFWDYADREYGDHGQHNIGSPLGAIASMASGGESGRPLELFPAAVQSALTDWPAGSLNTMIAKDADLFDFVVGVLLGSAER